ncbi:MAG: anti-sigma factor, partial [Acidobacteria bacterium]
MNHQEILENIPLYVAGELSPSEQAEMDTHLKNCESCRMELEEFRKMEGMLEQLRLPDPP